MNIADSFVPTAGVVGLLPTVTYFILVVAMFAFLSLFIFALASRQHSPSELSRRQRLSPVLTAMIAAVAGFSYYIIQTGYRTMLTELTTITDVNDRQTFFRESYNAIGQYRYMAWAVILPLLLLQVISLPKPLPNTYQKSLITLLIVSFFVILTGYIGHQQLSFDNEIQIGPKLIWGAVSMAGYAVILLTLYRFWKQVASTIQPDEQRIYRLIAVAFGTFWIMYPLGYILTVTPVDFNWIHIAHTLADVISVSGVGVGAYFIHTQPIDTK